VLTLARWRTRTTAQRLCPACDGARPHRTVWKKWGYPILRCESCGLGCTDAASFDPNSYYTADYFTGGHRDGYGDYVGSQAVLQAEFRSVLKHLNRYGSHCGRLFEVGCAYGYFLDVAREAGYDTVGLEICKDAVASCQSRGLNVHAGIVTPKFLEAHGPFDAVAMLDVIEHLPEPAETIAALSESLKPGGLMAITTGNWSSLLSSVTRSRWRLMTPPQHLYFYSRSTLSKLLANHGLKVVSLVAPWKRVPLGLIAYQLTRRLGLAMKLPRWLHNVGVPVNLFDAMRLIARKEAA
jgi:2-polyprenyl-3-methyl-5-hydroxy-6-metoxy-1,4-benzoquinol methylase